MKKIRNPELEVVRFGVEDLIVTSGGGGGDSPASNPYAAFTANTNYFTKLSEWQQGGFSGENNYIRFQYNGETLVSNDSQASYPRYNGLNYAYYNNKNGVWTVGNEGRSYSGKFPDGTD